MMTFHKSLCVAVSLLPVFTAGASAGTITLDSTALGSITSLFGFSSVAPGDLSTQTGVQELPQGPMGIGGVVAGSRAYETFDLSSLHLSPSEYVTGATLQLVISNYTSQGPGGMFPNFTTVSNPMELYSIFDVSTPYAELQTPFTNACGCFPPTPNADGLAAYADLGSGNVYATFESSQSIVGTPIDITLSAQAVADINAQLSGGFAVGITFTDTELPGLDGLFGAPLVQQTIELAQVDADQQLILTTASTVPEPATWLLSLGGFVGILAARRKFGSDARTSSAPEA
jgi:hypothetical protein